MEQSKPNPATRPTQDVGERKRIPMSTPRRRLEVPDLPGYHLHWFADRNIPFALQAWYEFVEDREVPYLNQRGVGTDTTISGNADMGTRVRQIGGIAEGGGVEHLTLMKIKEEYWREDQKAVEERNAATLSDIFKGEQILGSEKMSEEDRGLQYTKPSLSLFQRPKRVAKY